MNPATIVLIAAIVVVFCFVAGMLVFRKHSARIEAAAASVKTDAASIKAGAAAAAASVKADAARVSAAATAAHAGMVSAAADVKAAMKGPQ